MTENEEKTKLLKATMLRIFIARSAARWPFSVVIGLNFSRESLQQTAVQSPKTTSFPGFSPTRPAERVGENPGNKVASHMIGPLRECLHQVLTHIELRPGKILLQLHVWLSVKSCRMDEIFW